MSWFTVSANENEAGKNSYCMFIAVDFDFPSGHSRFWSGIGELVIGGNTFIGAGELGTATMPEERASLTFEPKVYQLSGVDPSLVAESDIDNCFGRSVVEYFGFLNPDTRQLVDTPEINFEGRMGPIRRVDGAEPIIEVTVDNRLAILDQADDWCYTDEHQQQFFSGDKGFNRVASLDLKKIFWGGRPIAPGGGIGALLRGLFGRMQDQIDNDGGT